MVEKFRELVALQSGWFFSYGRRDFHNLIEDSKVGESSSITDYFFLDPITDRDNLDNGHFEGKEYEGRFMLLSLSKLDENYDGQQGQDPSVGKWKANIDPKKSSLKTAIKNPLGCSPDYEILSWSEVDVINVTDLNADGILVSFKIKFYD